MNRLQIVATVLGALLLALCLGLIGGYLWGGHRQAQIDEGRAAEVSEQHALALASATERYREAERSGQQAVAAEGAGEEGAGHLDGNEQQAKVEHFGQRDG